MEWSRSRVRRTAAPNGNTSAGFRVNRASRISSGVSYASTAAVPAGSSTGRTVTGSRSRPARRGAAGGWSARRARAGRRRAPGDGDVGEVEVQHHPRQQVVGRDARARRRQVQAAALLPSSSSSSSGRAPEPGRAGPRRPGARSAAPAPGRVGRGVRGPWRVVRRRRWCRPRRRGRRPGGSRSPAGRRRHPLRPSRRGSSARPRPGRPTRRVTGGSARPARRRSWGRPAGSPRPGPGRTAPTAARPR